MADRYTIEKRAVAADGVEVASEVLTDADGNELLYTQFRQARDAIRASVKALLEGNTRRMEKPNRAEPLRYRFTEADGTQWELQVVQRTGYPDVQKRGPKPEPRERTRKQPKAGKTAPAAATPQEDLPPLGPEPPKRKRGKAKVEDAPPVEEDESLPFDADTPEE